MAKDVIMPVLGMNQETGTLVEWFKMEGDEVAKGDPLMVVATDKTEVEIEAMGSGVLSTVMAQPGDEVPVGSTIAYILAPGETAPQALKSDTQLSADDQADQVQGAEREKSGTTAKQAVSPVAARIAAEHHVDLGRVQARGDRIQKEDVLAHIAGQTRASERANGRILASPKARRIAQEEGLDLAAISGSGPEGAVLAADVLLAAEEASGTPSEVQAVSTPLTSRETAPMSRAWRVMARRLQESWQTVPHFFLERNIDASALISWQKRVQRRIDHKVTLTDLMTKVVASALMQHPQVNASWIDEQIIFNDAINMGLAVAVEDGLLVPVVHNANELGLGAIASRRADIVTRAMDGSLGMEDMQDGTFTISNLGMFGISKFNAIVNPPQAAILAVGAIEERVVPVKGKAKIRPMMTVTLSCDHRVVDGARSARFMQTLATYMADPLSMLE